MIRPPLRTLRSLVKSFEFCDEIRGEELFSALAANGARERLIECSFSRRVILVGKLPLFVLHLELKKFFLQRGEKRARAAARRRRLWNTRTANGPDCARNQEGFNPEQCDYTIREPGTLARYRRFL